MPLNPTSLLSWNLNLPKATRNRKSDSLLNICIPTNLTLPRTCSWFTLPNDSGETDLGLVRSASVMCFRMTRLLTSLTLFQQLCLIAGYYILSKIHSSTVPKTCQTSAYRTPLRNTLISDLTVCQISTSEWRFTQNEATELPNKPLTQTPPHITEQSTFLSHRSRRSHPNPLTKSPFRSHASTPKSMHFGHSPRDQFLVTHDSLSFSSVLSRIGHGNSLFRHQLHYALLVVHQEPLPICYL